MNISRDNYESYFMDYIDGKLDTGQMQILMSFIEFNPDLTKELEGIKITRLEPREYVYDQKAALRKPVSTPVSQTLLEADESIRYPGKSKLKKRYIDIPRVRMALSSVAAAAVLLLALSWLFRNAADRSAITESPNVTFIEGEAEPAESVPGKKTGENLPVNDRDPGTPASGVTVVNIDRTVEEAPKSDPEENLTSKVRTSAVGDESTLAEPNLMARVEPIGAEHISDAGRGTGHTLVYRLRGTEFDDYLGLKEYAMLQFNKRILSDPAEKKFSFWKLADAGIQRINEFSEGEYSLERKTDESGKTRRLTFETPLFGISAPMRNPNVPR